MAPPARPRYRFSGFVLSPARRSLRHGGREVPLIPRYLDLLLLLVERREEALHRQEILDRVWSDVVVSDGALSQAVRTLRRTLGESEGAPFIRTVSRHGYQFVCPVEEEEDEGRDDGELPAGRGAAVAVPEPRAEASGGDPLAGALARLLAPAATDEMRRDAAEELHGLGTAEALRRLARRPGHARAWAYLRDSRWDVAGAGDVPLLSAPGGLSAWAALAGLRLRAAGRLVGARWAAASLGGAAAGAFAGLAMAALGGSGEASLLGALAFVGASVAGAGAAGVGSGLAAAEVLVRSRRVAALALLGAIGGGLVGLLAHRAASSLLDGLFGLGRPVIGGALEGLGVGAAAGLGFGLVTSRLAGGIAAPRGRSRLATVAVTALASALGGGLVSAAGGRLGALSLDAIVAGFPSTRVELDRLARPFGEPSLGPRTGVALGLGEGLLFGAGLAAGLTRRPRRRDDELTGRDRETGRRRSPRAGPAC
jgi:DNA-binding winged helix-turn-helix (wHTH) protein